MLSLCLPLTFAHRSSHWILCLQSPFFAMPVLSTVCPSPLCTHKHAECVYLSPVYLQPQNCEPVYSNCIQLSPVFSTVGSLSMYQAGIAETYVCSLRNGLTRVRRGGGNTYGKIY